MSRRLLVSLAVCASGLALAATAVAAPLLTISRAERTAERHAERVADRFAGDDDVVVDEWLVDGCERDTRRRAVCAATYELSDGATCFDEVVVVKAKKTGKVTATSGGAAGAFDDCDEPEEELDDEGDEGEDLELAEDDLEQFGDAEELVEPVE